MSILSFVKGLLPKFNRDRLQEDINICRNELQNNVIVSYEAAAKVLTTMQSKKSGEFEKQWFSMVKTARKGPLVSSILKKLEETVPMLDLIEEYTKKEFEPEVITAGMTVLKSTVVRLVEIAGFTSTFALKFLNYLYTLEVQAAVSEPAKFGSKLTPGEIQMIESHFVEFCIAINVLSKDVKQAEKMLDAVPEVLVNARGEAALKVFGETRVDPLGTFMVKGFTGNPIYHIGMIVAEMQASRYKRAKELKSILELRLLNMQQIKDGAIDPVVEREIEVIQSRIEALDEKIRKVEESVQ